MNNQSSLSLGGQAPLPAVRRTSDRDEVRRLLELARPIAAPIFGYLDDRFIPHAHWYVPASKPTSALLCWVDGAPGANLYVQGDAEGASALLRQVDVPRYSFILFETRLEGLIREHFLLRELQRLQRMRVDRRLFTPAPPLPVYDPNVVGPVRLTGQDLHAVNALYGSESGARLTRDYLAGGVYYGMWSETRLVSIAGTQLFRPQHGIAVVANVFTHPRYRSRGYATQCVAAVTEQVLREVPDAVLNVDPRNTPALHSYERLGYEAVGTIGEAWACWKGRTWFDRLTAQMMHWLMG